MHDVWIGFIITLYAVNLFILWIIGNRLIKLGYYFADVWKSRPSHSNFPTTNSDQQPKLKSKIEQSDIDAIIPKLKNPPKSPGGFGSKVND